MLGQLGDENEAEPAFASPAGYPGNLLGSVVLNFLGSPLYALTVLALYFEIREREP